MSYSCKILAVDGGGIRGVIPAYILSQLERALSKPVYQCFDVIAGTSTGGLISLGLTTPVAQGQEPRSAEAILDLYMDDESQLFVYQSSGDYDEAEYYGTNTSVTPNTGIEPWIYSLFGDLTLSQAQAQLKALGNKMPRQVLTTCYTLTGAAGVPYGPYLFNWLAAQNSADDYCVWEAARATSAAPTYFPLANIGAGAPNGLQAAQRWACDGGVTSNNPALYALAQAFGLGLCQNLSDVLVVSLGTGLYNAGIAVPDNVGNWGAWYDWTDGSDTNGNDTAPLLNVLAMSNQMAPDQQLRTMLPPANYFRFEPLLTYGESSMDGTDAPTLKKIATAYIAAGGEGFASFNAVISALQA